MLDGYQNILANRFMRDTNYIIIKDTDDIEELEREWELFNTSLTNKQKRLSDDRSIEIWNMTNEEHYLLLRQEIIGEEEHEEKSEDENTELDTMDFNDDLESFNINDYISDNTEDNDFDSEELTINPELKDFSIEESTMIDTSDIIDTSEFEDSQKNAEADQYEIDTNINIIGHIYGDNPEELYNNLKDSYNKWMDQSVDHRRKSDDKCREIYGKSNLERYNSLMNTIQTMLYKKLFEPPKEDITSDKIIPDDLKSTEEVVNELGGFVLECYNNRQLINEGQLEDFKKSHKHKRFNDTPYFTPSEMIDLGVCGNGNFYSPVADNDGLITNIKTPTWFDNYKDMCLDHIFEDYTSDWIDTLDMLYSDFDKIKESGNESAILARKQSILDLGWNPEIKFNRVNRIKATKRVNDILESSIQRDIFINIKDIPKEEDSELMQEMANKSTHKPVLLIFTQGKTPIVSQGIKHVTGSVYSHASISFDPSLDDTYSYNLRLQNAGFTKENRQSFLDNDISIMAFFAPNKKSSFDLRIFLNKILHIDKKPSKNEYKQVCSTFVDTVLKSQDINLVGSINIPDPGQLYTATKSQPNKIIEVYNGPVQEYDETITRKKLNFLLKSGIESIEESKLDKTVQNEDWSKKKIIEQVSFLNEVKQFPVEFDKEGNLIIYKCRTGNISYEDEIKDSVELLKSYRNTQNIEGMKYELAKIWFLIDSIEKELKKKSLSQERYKELIESRAAAMNIFKSNFEYICKAEKGFNFSDYYNTTPFSDNSVKITANTLKHSFKYIRAIISPVS